MALSKYPKTFLPFHLLACLVLTLGANVLYAKGGAKVSICHTPPGHFANRHTLKVSARALRAHLAHGDVTGACDQTPRLVNLQILAINDFQGTIATSSGSLDGWDPVDYRTATPWRLELLAE